MPTNTKHYRISGLNVSKQTKEKHQIVFMSKRALQSGLAWMNLHKPMKNNIYTDELQSTIACIRSNVSTQTNEELNCVDELQSITEWLR